MGLEVLEERWTPPVLVGRMDRVRLIARLVAEGRRVAVIGVSGAGKSTAVRKGLGLVGVDAVWIDCSSNRSYYTVRRKISNGWNVLDDYTLAKRDRNMRALISRIKAVVIVHPWHTYPELQGYEKVEMPPYNSQELYDIMADRVVRGDLDVDEDSLAYISEVVGHPRGPGSARIALQLLKLSLELGGGKTNIEITKDVVKRFYL